MGPTAGADSEEAGRGRIVEGGPCASFVDLVDEINEAPVTHTPYTHQSLHTSARRPCPRVQHFMWRYRLSSPFCVLLCNV